ncbi:MAG: hypothetical protein MUC88_00070 [Planctomycetes bacterium]|jgi:hypothetical protein|nr:hypothetical protein [Planctomycetota bacterium]
MAARKPLFMGTEGFSEEMATGDSMTLGGLTMGGNIAMGTNKVTGMGAATGSGDALAYGQSGGSLAGLALTGNLTMGDNKITGLGAPSAAGDAASKSYVDTMVVTGGQFKAALLTTDQKSDSLGIKAAEVLFFAAQPVATDTVIFKNGTLTRTYTFVANQGAESADTDVSIESDAVTAMQRLVTRAMADTGNTQWDLFWEPADQDRINADGVIVVVERTTASGASASRIYGVWGTQTNSKVVQYASGATPTVANDYTGITAVDLPSSDPAAGRFGYRAQAAALVDGELHYFLGEDEIWGWDADTDVWQQFSGTGSIPDATSAAGGGTKGKMTADEDYALYLATGILRLKLSTSGGLQFATGTPKELAVKIEASKGLTVGGNGLAGVADSSKAMSVGASGFGVDIAASNPGLQYDGSGDLQVKPNGNKGVAVDGDGVQVKVDGTTITFNGSGQIQAAETAEAKRVENTLTTATDTVAVADPVYANGDETIGKADTTDTKARVLGIIRSGSGAAPQAVQVVTCGRCDGVLSSATANTPYYLQDGGGIGTGLPAAGKRVILIGYAIGDTDLMVDIKDYGKKAA